jgi:hypothetical protein
MPSTGDGILRGEILRDEILRNCTMGGIPGGLYSLQAGDMSAMSAAVSEGVA